MYNLKLFNKKKTYVCVTTLSKILKHGNFSQVKGHTKWYIIAFNQLSKYLQLAFFWDSFEYVAICMPCACTLSPISKQVAMMIVCLIMINSLFFLKLVDFSLSLKLILYLFQMNLPCLNYLTYQFQLFYHGYYICASIIQSPSC